MEREARHGAFHPKGRHWAILEESEGGSGKDGAEMLRAEWKGVVA